MILGYLIALLVAANTPLRKFTRGVVFVPVVIGLGVSSLLWYWLFSYDFGLVNRALIDLGIIAKPIVWFGESADRALWAVIASIVWKVLGFGMLLFVAAIQAIPQEINEATMVDGASYWQRVRRITLPLTARTILLVTLFSVIGSLLAFDQFYPHDRGTAVQPDGDIGVLGLSQLLPLPEARLRRGALADPGGHRARLHGRSDDAHAPEPGVSARATPMSAACRIPRRRAAREHGTHRESRSQISRGRRLPRALRRHADAAGLLGARFAEDARWRRRRFRRPTSRTG